MDLPSAEHYLLYNLEKNREIFELALQENVQKTHFCRPLFYVVPDYLLFKVLQVFLRVVDLIGVLTLQCWGHAAYKFLCIVIDPLDLLAGAISLTIRVAATFLGTMSPWVGLNGWWAAEVIDISILKMRLGLFEWLSLGALPGATLYPNEPVLPFRARLYLGDACDALASSRLSVADQNFLDGQLKKAMGNFIETWMTQGQYAPVVQQGLQEENVVFQKVFGNGDDYAAISLDILSAHEVWTLFSYIDEKLPASPELDPLRKTINQWINTRFRCGVVSYYYS